MLKFHFTLLITTLSTFVYGQTITVTEQGSNEPIELATIASNSPKVFVTTDKNGQADISAFATAKYIEIRFIGYRTVKTSFHELQQKSFKIELTETGLAMDEVVISANKWEQSVYEIPNKIISINENAINYSNPQTSADMLTATGEVFVQKSQYGGGSPKLRGFAANSVLMVIDGVRMNNAIYRSGNLQNIISIDPNSLEGAEVVLGPGSVIYGSDAMGGVMDFHSKQPNYSTDKKLNIGGSAMTRYSSASEENTFHTDLNLGWSKVATYTSFSYSKLGDLRAGSKRPDGYDDFGKRNFYVGQDAAGNDIVTPNDDPNLQIGSGFDSRSLIQKLSFRANDYLAFGYNFYYSTTSDVPRYDRLITTDENNVPNDAEWYYGPQEWIMHSANMKIVKPALLFSQMKVVLAYQDYEESRVDRAFGDDRLRTRTEAVDVYSFNVDLDKGLTKGNLFYGAEVLYNDINSSAKRVNRSTGEVTFPATRYPDGGSKYWSYAAYLSHKWNINSNWTFNSGARYSYVKLVSRITDQSALSFPFEKITVDNGALNGSLGIVYSPKRTLKVNLALASGFRAPNVDDVGKVFDFSDGEVQVPNANLEPEYSYNIEAGIETKLSNAIEVGVIGFYTLVDNAMVRRDFTFNGQDSIVFDGGLSKVVALTNTGEADIYGFSLEFEINPFTHWLLKGSLTGVYGEDKTNNEPLRHTTPLFGKIDATYGQNKLKATLSVNFNDARFRKDIPSSEIDDKPELYAQHNSDRTKDGSPGWYTVNLQGAYDFNKHFQLSGGIENIFDIHYRPYSSGISAPGRNFIIALRAKL
jgi:hemoglobin/transferrin/lactoferrin receptor protein